MSLPNLEEELQEAWIDWRKHPESSNMPFDEWLSEVMYRE